MMKILNLTKAEFSIINVKVYKFISILKQKRKTKQSENLATA